MAALSTPGGPKVFLHRQLCLAQRKLIYIYIIAVTNLLQTYPSADVPEFGPPSKLLFEKAYFLLQPTDSMHPPPRREAFTTLWLTTPSVSPIIHAERASASE